MLKAVADIVGWVNLGVCGLLALFFLPRILMFFYSCFDKPIKYKKASVNHKYAVIVCARNEEGVIANVIESIKRQDYALPVDVFVAADNCTDATARVAREAGAIVYERFCDTLKGKAYALDFVFKQIFEKHSEEGYEAFIIFDADNVASKGYVRKMNDAFDTGLEIITSFRNTKNFSHSWLTRGAALMMMYDSRFAQHAKVKWGMSAFVAGTGFLVSANIIKEQGGWIHNSAMTEDLEFSVAKILEGRRIGYCYAEFFEEQPATIKASAHQRARWIRGGYQVYGLYWRQLWKGFLFGKKQPKGKRWTLFDVIEFTFPTPMLVTIWFVSYYASMLLLGILAFIGVGGEASSEILYTILQSFAILMGVLIVGCMLMGTAITIKLRRQIKGTTMQKIRAPFAYMIFLFSWIPISFMGAYKKLKWHTIPRTDNKKIESLEDGNEDNEA